MSVSTLVQHGPSSPHQCSARASAVTSAVTSALAVPPRSTVTGAGTSTATAAVASIIAVTNTATLMDILTVTGTSYCYYHYYCHYHCPCHRHFYCPVTVWPPHWHQGRPGFQPSSLSLGSLGLPHPSLGSSCSSLGQGQDVQAVRRCQEGRAGQREGSVCNMVALSKHAQDRAVPGALKSPGHSAGLSLGSCSLS